MTRRAVSTHPCKRSFIRQETLTERRCAAPRLSRTLTRSLRLIVSTGQFGRILDASRTTRQAAAVKRRTDEPCFSSSGGIPWQDAPAPRPTNLASPAVASRRSPQTACERSSPCALSYRGRISSQDRLGAEAQCSLAPAKSTLGGERLTAALIEKEQRTPSLPLQSKSSSQARHRSRCWIGLLQAVPLADGREDARSRLSICPVPVSSSCPSIFDFVHLQSSPTALSAPSAAMKKTSPSTSWTSRGLRAAQRSISPSVN